MMSYNIYYEHYACSVTDAIVFPLFSVLVWTGENNSNTLSVDAYIFWKRRKKISVSEISGYMWKGPLISKKLCACITRFGTLQDYDVQLPRFALNKRLQFPQIFSILLGPLSLKFHSNRVRLHLFDKVPRSALGLPAWGFKERKVTF